MSHDIRTPMNAIVGMTSIAAANIDDKAKVQNCLKKITLSLTKNSPRLVVKRRKDGETVIDFPLNEYLLIMKSDRYEMGNQEYLDRESRWTLFFFLRNGIWLQTRIVVNDWVVRINNVEA